jgi:uncharacterized protein (TIGR00369 family)
MIKRVIESPHNLSLGMRVVDAPPPDALVRMPMRPDFVGDPVNRIFHGGPVTVLLDATFVAATYLALDRAIPIATVDLRIDYLKPVSEGEALYALCRCERLTRHIAFLRGHVYVDQPDRIVAMGTSSYMLDTRESK